MDLKKRYLVLIASVFIIINSIIASADCSPPETGHWIIGDGENVVCENKIIPIDENSDVNITFGG